MAAERFPRSLHPRRYLSPTWPTWEEPAGLAQGEKYQAEMQFGETRLILLSRLPSHISLFGNLIGELQITILVLIEGPFFYLDLHRVNQFFIWSNIFSRLTSQLRASRTELRRVYKIALTQMTSKLWSRFSAYILKAKKSAEPAPQYQEICRKVHKIKMTQYCKI